MGVAVDWLRKLFGERGKMAALSAGTLAPDFSLTTTDGKSFNLKDALARGPVVAFFFKISCPVCQYTAPFVQRIFQAARNSNVTIVGISQDNVRDTRIFLEEFGGTYPVLIDDIKTSYQVSSAYGLTNVPTLFWIGQDGEIEISSVGWSKADIEQIYRRIVESKGDGQVPLFQPGEEVRDFRAG
jgi:peroxiredoxin